MKTHNGNYEYCEMSKAVLDNEAQCLPHSLNSPHSLAGQTERESVRNGDLKALQLAQEVAHSSDVPTQVPDRHRYRTPRQCPLPHTVLRNTGTVSLDLSLTDFILKIKPIPYYAVFCVLIVPAEWPQLLNSESIILAVP